MCITSWVRLLCWSKFFNTVSTPIHFLEYFLRLAWSPWWLSIRLCRFANLDAEVSPPEKGGCLMQSVYSDNKTSVHIMQAKRTGAHVCMHIRGSARSDARVMREATALVEAGFRVCIVDVEQKSERPNEEYIAGVKIKHLYLTGSFSSPRFKFW